MIYGLRRFGYHSERSPFDCSAHGGSWGDGPRDLRSAYRSGNETGIRDYNGGFRVARTLTP